MDEALTKTEREAMKAIYRLSDDRREVQTGSLAELLGVVPGTATATIKRLAARGLVEHRPYKGVELTETGRPVAVAAIRRHRICERFLADYLGYSWQEADELATAFEHDLPQAVEDRIFEALGRPASCPHGFPVPSSDGEVTALPRLVQLEVGGSAVVALPGWMEAGVVDFLSTLGVRPGARIEVLDKQPFDGPLTVLVDGNQQVLGSKVAGQISVTSGGTSREEGRT